MQRSILFVNTALIIALSGLTGLMATGCSSNKSNKPLSQAQPQTPSRTQQEETGPAWTLQLKSNCMQGAQDQCVAKYGFAVTADGKYHVGPGPQGELRSGVLGDTEFAAIKTKLAPALGTAAGPSGSAEGVANDSDDQLTLSRPGAPDRVLASNVAADFHFAVVTSDQAQALHDAIRELANSLYRLPFGNACGDAADKITAAFPPLQNCQVDDDCIYVDASSGFEVVPPAGVQWLLTEDCTAVRPMTVANKLAIVGGAQNLVGLYTAARAACGDAFEQSYYGIDCSYQQQSTATAPACVQNRCQARF